MKRIFALFSALIMLFSVCSANALTAYSASKAYAQDKLVEIEKQSGFIPGKTSAVQNNCYGFISKVCEKLYGVPYQEGIYDNYKVKHQTGNYYTVATYTTSHKSPTSEDIENIISFFIKNAVPGDIVHYGSYDQSVSKTHTVMIQSIDNKKMSVYHSNYQIAQNTRETCHIDDIYWDSFRKSPTQHVKNADGTLYSLNAMLYNTMKVGGVGITINRYKKYEEKFYLVGAAVPKVTTSRSSTTGIQVSWDEIINAKKYKVEYKKSTDSSYITASSGCTKTTYTINGLTTGATYNFRVAAYVGSKWMNYSDPVSKQVLPPTIADIKFNLEDNGINIKWAKRSDITGVKIYRSTDKENYSKIKTVTDNSLDTYLDKKVDYGKTYYYKFERYITVSGKTYSTTSAVKTASYVLSKPSVSYENISSSSVEFSVNTNGFSNGFDYYITDSSSKNVVSLTSTKEIKITAYKLNVGEKYNFNCRQKSSLGKGEYAILTFQVLPKKETVSSAKNTAEGIKITYAKESDVSGYCIYRSTSQNGSYNLIETIENANTNTYVDGAIKYNTEYYYKVRSYVLVNSTKFYGAYSDASAAVKNTVGKPAGLTATRKTPTSVTLKWNAVKNANQYIVEYKMEGESWQAFPSVKGTSKTVSKLKLGKVYYFRVKAGNNIGFGSFCSKISKKALPPTPAAPTLKVKSNGIRVYWKAKDYATGYKIYRATSKNGKYTLVKTVTNPKTSAWTDKSVKKNKGYYYKMVCYVTKGKTTYNSPKSPYKYIKFRQ